MRILSLSLTHAPARAEVSRLIAALVCIALGTAILLGVGFAPVEAVHSAAHDVRHVFALPCH